MSSLSGKNRLISCLTHMEADETFKIPRPVEYAWGLANKIALKERTDHPKKGRNQMKTDDVCSTSSMKQRQEAIKSNEISVK